MPGASLATSIFEHLLCDEICDGRMPIHDGLLLT
jgi:hypothetical protein